jgi:ankyrin repeat protein
MTSYPEILRQLPKFSHQACRNGYVEVVRYHVENYPEPGHLLYVACKCGHVEIVRFLLQTQSPTHDAMITACEHGHLEIVQLLIEHGMSDFERYLHEATYSGNLQLVKFFFSRGVSDPSIALAMAAQEGYLHRRKAAVQYLLSFNSDQESKNKALLRASQYGKIDIVRILVDSGANNIEDALKVGINHNRGEVIEFLLPLS